MTQHLGKRPSVAPASVAGEHASRDFIVVTRSPKKGPSVSETVEGHSLTDCYPFPAQAFAFVIIISYLLPFAVLPIFYVDKRFFVRESASRLYPPAIFVAALLVLDRATTGRFHCPLPALSVFRDQIGLKKNASTLGETLRRDDHRGDP